MRRVVLAVVATTMLSAAGSALAQTPPPPGVETMTCKQMYAEMMGAGQQMSRQMDPSLGADAQAMLDRSKDPNAIAQAAGKQAAVSAACSNPLTIVACKAAQSAYAADMQAQTAANHARMADTHNKMQAATAGLDMQRMMAISDRVEALKCPQPTGPGG